jgi:hypothetical protein
MDNSSDTTPQSSATPTPVAGSVVSQRRRRFIQAGVVPIGLTLASRPAMAWHCNSTSAWGSAILRDGGASVKARAAAAVVENNECWFVTNWTNNTGRGQVLNGVKPWTCVNPKFFRSKSASDVAYAQANLKVSQLYPGGLSGVSGTKKVFEVVAASGTYGAAMCVARLNVLLAGTGGAKIAQCTVTSAGDMLDQMAKPNFKPSNSSGAAWTTGQIQQYLSDNYIARVS